MRKVLKSSILTCVTLVGLCTTTTAFADSHLGYSYESNIGYQNSTWMSELEDSKKISGLSIPGTHGSMALHGVSVFDEN
ncbi:phosphatidylinositol phosphodiesterase, partial [Bacillus thuringiensis]|nr:phosphatidylinositol phosphodiesterase [Bacillus thuringiensis]